MSKYYILQFSQFHFYNYFTISFFIFIYFLFCLFTHFHLFKIYLISIFDSKIFILNIGLIHSNFRFLIIRMEFKFYTISILHEF